MGNKGDFESKAWSTNLSLRLVDQALDSKYLSMNLVDYDHTLELKSYKAPQLKL